MAKFLNKKEQVYELKLTTYGHYLLSVGTFKPVYYGFFDDNVAYDRQYFLSASVEPQNDIHERIKDNTQYLEAVTLFEDAEDFVNKITDSGYTFMESKVTSGRGMGFGSSAPGQKVNRYNQQYYSADVTPTTNVPRNSIYKFDNAIGDAYLDGNNSRAAPAWKVVALTGRISGSTAKDTEVSTGYDVQVPQIDLEVNYRTLVKEANYEFDPEDLRNIIDRTPRFADNKIIVLESQDALIYADELNTQLLTENFDIEIFEVEDAATVITPNKLHRKYFQKKIPQIINGFMQSAMPEENPKEDLTTDSVEYYFDVLVDDEINQRQACKGAEVFNKESYYVDLDFDCDQEEQASSYYDIYGSVTEPEICQSQFQKVI